MSRPIIAVSKFVGTISLGLLTVKLTPASPPPNCPIFYGEKNGFANHPCSHPQGISYTHSTLTLPPLLLLPTLPPALSTFLSLKRRTSKQQFFLSVLATTSLLLAYTLSSRRTRHPYLLWTVATTVLATSGAVERWPANRCDEQAMSAQDANGEVVREGMEAWTRSMGWRAGILGLGFSMSVVGIWGDGF